MSAGACAWTGEAVFESPGTATSASTARIIRFISLSSELVRAVVLERELHLQPIALEPVREVLAAAPLEFAAHHHVLGRVIQKVSECVMAHPEGVRRLAVGIVVVLHRVADGA